MHLRTFNFTSPPPPSVFHLTPCNEIGKHLGASFSFAPSAFVPNLAPSLLSPSSPKLFRLFIPSAYHHRFTSCYTCSRADQQLHYIHILHCRTCRAKLPGSLPRTQFNTARAQALPATKKTRRSILDQTLPLPGDFTRQDAQSQVSRSNLIPQLEPRFYIVLWN